MKKTYTFDELDEATQEFLICEEIDLQLMNGALRKEAITYLQQEVAIFDKIGDLK
jgi:hypothetical protein